MKNITTILLCVLMGACASKNTTAPQESHENKKSSDHPNMIGVWAVDHWVWLYDHGTPPPLPSANG